MSFDLTTSGADELRRRFSGSLEDHQQAALIALAHEAESRIAPYPAQPAPAREDYWYVRGTGSHYRRKRGGVTIRKTSQMLGRRWRVMEQGRLGAVLKNLASYSGVVHRAEDQARIHQETGWRTDKGVLEEMRSEGLIGRVAIEATLKGLGAKQ